MISHFSDNLTRIYLPNALWHSRYIYQKGWLFPRSPTYTIQPASGPNIILMNNNPNWENATATNSATNRSNSFTCLQSKLQCNNNTNEQLADILSHIANKLIANQTPNPNSNSRETKAYISDTFSSTESDKLNNFLF